MGMMKAYMMDTQERMIEIASEKGGISRNTIWNAIEEIAEWCPTSEGPIEDTYDVCQIAKNGEESIIAEYMDRTGCFVHDNTIEDFGETFEFDSKDKMLCDIMYTLRELRRDS